LPAPHFYAYPSSVKVLDVLQVFKLKKVPKSTCCGLILMPTKLPQHPLGFAERPFKRALNAYVSDQNLQSPKE
jgi:hypothetical protein